MVDEQDPAKRVVKRVVKKTVVPPAPQTPAPPTVRYGRPVATAARPQAKAVARPGARSAPDTTPPAPGTLTPATKAPRQKSARQRPTVDLSAKAAGARELAGRAWWATADTTADVSKVVARSVATWARAVAAYRLPHINLYLASVITGAVVGLLAVGLGAGSLAVFDSVRGVSSGGGFWGGLAFVLVAAASLFVGEALLRGFGAHSARLTSFLAIVLVVVAMLGVFLDRADSAAAIVLLPLLGMAGYALAHWLVDLAENAPAIVE
jgi:hypothetical protein